LSKSSSALQPLLFRFMGVHYVKVDKQVIAVQNVANFCDAVSFLMNIYYVCNLTYDYELKPTVGLLEKVWGMPISIGNSYSLSDFVRLALNDCISAC
jgi:hypothetical protein